MHFIFSCFLQEINYWKRLLWLFRNSVIVLRSSDYSGAKEDGSGCLWDSCEKLTERKSNPSVKVGINSTVSKF